MNVLRLTGIASGFDTEQIIQDLMRVERLKVDRFYQQRQTLEWQKEQYRELINKVRVFRDTYFDLLKPETNLTSPAALKKMSVTVSEAELVTVTASANAVLGESTFQVLQSAAAAKAVSSGITAGSEHGERLSLADTMGELAGKLAAGLTFVFDENDQFTLTINDEAIIINKSDTLQAVLTKINNSKAGVQVSYSSFSDSLTMTARQTGHGYITTDDGGHFFSP